MTNASFHDGNARLREIQDQLLRNPQIEDAAVVSREVAGETYAVAYVVPGEDSHVEAVLNAETLRMQLKAVLPEYMVPRALVVLERLPRTTDGTLDQHALPVPELDLQEAEQYQLPQGTTEQVLAEIWRDMLQVEEIGRHTSFFDLGGHSLNAIRMLHLVKERLGAEFRINDVYQSPTLCELAARIDEGVCADELVDLQQEAVLDEDIRPCSGRCSDPAKGILLTGATGFVGRFLLRNLLESSEATIYCLVRAPSAHEAMARLRGTLAKWELWRDDFESRLVAVPGSLSASRLGIEQDTYQTLADRVDVIYHCGASVNHLESYASARPANVDGAKELLRLAVESRLKVINYVSTLAVFSSEGAAGRSVVDESSSIEHEKHRRSNGYEASKWVAEKLFMTASERGIPCNIFRLGLVGPDALGRYDEQQREYIMLKSCILSGYAIEGYRHEMPLIPVDYSVQAITRLAAENMAGKGIFHVCGSGDAMEDVFERCGDVHGLALAQKSWFEWIGEIKRLRDEGRSLPAVPLVDFAFPMDEQSFRDHQRRREQLRTSFDCGQTRCELAVANVLPRVFDDAALRTLIGYMLAHDAELRSRA